MIKASVILSCRSQQLKARIEQLALQFGDNWEFGGDLSQNLDLRQGAGDEYRGNFSRFSLRCLLQAR
jgi:hypothetical protein